jgi:hypothetical protein
MVDRLREFKKSGKILGVIAIADYQPESSSNQWMAEAVDHLKTRFPGARILVFSGNYHASKLPAGSDDKAASLLNPADVASIDILGAPGGTAWDVRDAGPGIHPAGGVEHAPGVVEVEPGAPARLKERGFDYVAYLGIPTTASEPALAKAFALTAPVRDAFATVEDEQNKLPPAKDDRERLERMLDLDQDGRNALSGLNFATLPQEQQMAAQDLVRNEINTRDLSDQKALKAMMPAKGWFDKSRYGSKAATAAFLIVQHAVNDPDLMRTALKRMEPLVKTGEVDGEDYGLLYDRVSLEFDHRPQRYGSQVECKDGKWQPRSLEDPARVDLRRKAAGFHMTEEEYIQHFAGRPCQ